MSKRETYAEERNWFWAGNVLPDEVKAVATLRPHAP